VTQYEISSGDEVAEFEDKRVLVGDEGVTDAAGRHWRLLGHHRGPDGSEWADHFDAELVEPLD
jgi:hypothetical protein